MKGERVAAKVKSNKPYRFNTLNQYLRQGFTPESLGGVKIGKGAVKAVYKFSIKDRMTGEVTDYVIKSNEQGGLGGNDDRKFPQDLIDAGAIPIKSTRIGSYIMQEYITPFHKNGNHPYFKNSYREYENIQVRLLQNKKFYDLHKANAGFDSKGNCVIFDW